MFYWGEWRMLLDDDPDDWRQPPPAILVDLVAAFNRMSFFFQAEDGIRDWRDWSSDVCSSDLWRCWSACVPASRGCHRARPSSRRSQSRSEERRVGKECRSRWSPYH